MVVETLDTSLTVGAVEGVGGLDQSAVEAEVLQVDAFTIGQVQQLLWTWL